MPVQRERLQSARLEAVEQRRQGQGDVARAEAAVVEQDDFAGAGARGDPFGDDARRRRGPVGAGPRPQNQRQVQPAADRQRARAKAAVRRAVQPGIDARDFMNRLARQRQFGDEARLGKERHGFVVEAVAADFVTGFADAAQQVFLADGLRRGHEERRECVSPGEGVQDPWRNVRVRPVVERQIDAAGIAAADDRVEQPGGEPRREVAKVKNWVSFGCCCQTSKV